MDLFEIANQEWRQYAACSGKPQYFDLPEFVSIDNEPERKAKMALQFDEAEKICSTCPVIKECYDSATKEDLENTYRAGLLPANFKARPQGRPKKVYDKCQRGHDNWKVIKAGRECGTCREAANARFLEKSLLRDPSDYDGKVCINGHVGQYKMYTDGWRCRTCKNTRKSKR